MIGSIYLLASGIIVGSAMFVRQDYGFLSFELWSLTSIMLMALAGTMWVIGEMSAFGGLGVILLGLVWYIQGYVELAGLDASWTMLLGPLGFVGALMLLWEGHRQFRVSLQSGDHDLSDSP